MSHFQEKRAYVFIDDAGNVADREELTDAEANARNAYADQYAAHHQDASTLRWKPVSEAQP